MFKILGLHCFLLFSRLVLSQLGCTVKLLGDLLKFSVLRLHPRPSKFESQSGIQISVAFKALVTPMCSQGLRTIVAGQNIVENDNIYNWEGERGHPRKRKLDSRKGTFPK